MTSPNFNKGTGRLVTDRFDFAKHLNGSDFRHSANQIDINDPSLVFGNPSNVEQALEDLNNFVISQQAAGVGFIALPDGYDTYHAQDGNINFDITIPSIDTVLNPIFSAIINNTDMPGGLLEFERVRYGGVILIKSGTYIVKDTINIPPGIVLLGEGYGTKIVNATSLDTTVLPPIPKGSPTPAPIFGIIADGYRSGNDTAVDPTMFIFQRETKIMNMVISDNFVEPTQLGDTFYKLPQNKTSLTFLDPPSLISQQLGSNLSLLNIIATGRVNFSSGQIVSQSTGSLISIDTATADTETFCKIDNCFFDGFSIPFDFSNSSDGYDYLEIKNSKIRAYGYYNGDSTDGYANTIVKSHSQNINILGCTIYGNASNITSLLYLTAHGSTPNLQARNKISIVGNQIIINKLSNSTNSTFVPIYYSSSFTTPSQTVSSLVYGNSFQDTFDIYVDDGYQYSAPGIGSPQFSINGTAKTTTLRNDNITLNGDTSIPSLIGTTVMNSSAILSGGSGASIQMQSGSSVLIGPGSELVFTGIVSNNATLLIDGYTTLSIHAVKIQIGARLVNTSTYVIDSGTTPPLGPGYDNIIHIDTTVSTSDIFLPQPTQGRYLVFKDIGGAAATHNIFIHPHASEAIEGLHAIYVIPVNHRAVTLHSDGTDWWIIAIV